MPGKRPNIVFFFTDDQRFDALAAMNNPDVKTPTLDALAAEGVLFTHAHIMGGTSPAVCMPSRAMLNSGRTLFHIDQQGQNIPEEHTTLGEALRSAGYQTFGTGKWHNGTKSYNRSFSDGGEIFFGGMQDHWNVPACDYHPDGKYPARKPLHCKVGKAEGDYDMCFDHVRKNEHSSDLFAAASEAFLDRRDTDRPFYMYVSFMAPHDPRETHPEYHAMYDPAKIRLPENFLPEHPFDNGELEIRDELLAAFPRTEAEVRQHIAEYYAIITHADAAIGRVIRKLKDVGEYDNTIIVFAGDNGLAVGQHGLMGKQSLYDHSVRVPLMFAGPGIPKGQRCDGLCFLLDIFPTLCDLTGTPIPDSVEGVSLKPMLDDPDARVRDCVHLAYRDFQRGVSDGRFKRIDYFVKGQRTTQLFDLENDPREMNDLADDPAHADTRARLGKLMLEWRDELDDTAEKFWDGFDPN